MPGSAKALSEPKTRRISTHEPTVSTPTPSLDLDVIQEFGPTRAYATDARLDSGVEPDRLVKTHCCFCGQQCGMQLKVKDNTVIGFEPVVRVSLQPAACCARRA